MQQETATWPIGCEHTACQCSHITQRFSHRLQGGAEFVNRVVHPPPVTGTILLSVLRALAAAHELGYIHRDVKASNILLGSEVGTLSTQHLERQSVMWCQLEVAYLANRPQRLT